MATYDFNTSSPNTPGSSGVGVRSTQASLLSKTFLYMFFFLMITVAVTIGVSLIFQNSPEVIGKKTISGMLSSATSIMLIKGTHKGTHLTQDTHRVHTKNR